MKKLAVVLTLFLAFAGVSALRCPYVAHARKAESSESVHIVNINKAKVEDLILIKGIGPSLAARIVRYRQDKGSFKSTEDLMGVKGIGSGKLAKIKASICV